jgi:AcrR family transcriptional regulator
VTGARRSDAERNRARVLEAAAEEHAVSGDGLGMQEVARRAGVGVGTVYRHFASREALIEAIAHPFHERSLELARIVREERVPAERFDAYVRRFAQELADSGLSGQALWDAPAAEHVREELRSAVARLVGEAKAGGALRGDLQPEDAFATLWTIAVVVEASAEPVWRRYLDLVLDGLRSGLPEPLATPPFSRAAWDAFVRSRGSQPER